MQADIRNRKHISHKDIIELNFIRKQNKYVFRKYYKQGLRSHIMEVLHAGDVLKQNKGDTINGIRHYPIAKPFKTLRIFRTKFNSLSEIMKKIGKYKIIEAISIIEQKLLNRTIDKSEKIYRTFLDSQRMQKVKDLDVNFHHSL